MSVRRNRRRMVWYASAACIIVALGAFFGLRFGGNTVSGVEQYVYDNEVPVFEKSDSVQLRISSAKTVVLKDKARVVYDTEAEKIRVGDRSVEDIAEDVLTYNTLTVPYGKRAELKLSDGSSVWLNSGSRLVYPAHFGKDTREVYLSGEAIFDVAHDSSRPFTVKTPERSSVEVLGTLFNISAYPGDNSVDVALLRGKVRVAYRKRGWFSDKMVQREIVPGMHAVIEKDKETLYTEETDVASLMSWRRGYYEFSGQTLQQVLDKLSKYYNVTFHLTAGTDMEATYSGAFKLNDHLDKVTTTLSATTGMDFIWDRETRNITIKPTNN